MTFCATCAKNVAPVTALHKVYGICEQCPTCQTPFVQVQGGGDLTRQEGRQGTVPALPATQPVIAPAVPKPATAPATTTDNITAMMRARLAEVEKEIATRIGFEAERDRLKRMLAAAGEAEPLAVSLAN